MGNHMAQLLFARTVQTLCQRQIAIEGYDIEAWGLRSQRTDDQKSILSVGSHLTSARLVAKMIDFFKPHNIDLDGVILRASNLLPPEHYSDLFPLMNEEGVDTPDSKLLINIRLGDIMNPSHPHYGPLPITYYQYLTDLTGLSPVFMGELDEGPYMDSLRQVFPDAEYRDSVSPLFDFQTIMRAKNIAISVSSFSWLAAYLSRANSVHVPVAGMINPRVRPDIDMIPAHDPRFVFHSVDDFAWDRRYTNFFPSRDGFKLVSAAETGLRSAKFKTLVRSSRIHLGLARRMITQSGTA